MEEEGKGEGLRKVGIPTEGVGRGQEMERYKDGKGRREGWSTELGWM